ncbi:hypothetical protein [Bradyrhizobium sp. AS23.2]|uniref:hypothetical protein n=1 Tax=Bradyrhizobium sp. AS23.2 TaxID=1680155 RepID=UPI00116114BB|nr:hypothetical protein [Bradyrhizobium sp. AS23.2]
MRIIDLLLQEDKGAIERRHRQVYSACILEGRVARAVRVPLKDCPPYVDEDMSISWRMGWRWEMRSVA